MALQLVQKLVPQYRIEGNAQWAQRIRYHQATERLFVMTHRDMIDENGDLGAIQFGSVEVFSRNPDNTFTRIDRVLPPAGATTRYDQHNFGFNLWVSPTGKLLAVGSRNPYSPDETTYHEWKGRIFLYTWNGSQYNFVTTYIVPNAEDYTQMGAGGVRWSQYGDCHDVNAGGNTLLIGCINSYDENGDEVNIGKGNMGCTYIAEFDEDNNQIVWGIQAATRHKVMPNCIHGGAGDYMPQYLNFDFSDPNRFIHPQPNSRYRNPCAYINIGSSNGAATVYERTTGAFSEIGRLDNDGWEHAGNNWLQHFYNSSKNRFVNFLRFFAWDHNFQNEIYRSGAVALFTSTPGANTRIRYITCETLNGEARQNSGQFGQVHSCVSRPDLEYLYISNPQNNFDVDGVSNVLAGAGAFFWCQWNETGQTYDLLEKVVDPEGRRDSAGFGQQGQIDPVNELLFVAHVNAQYDENGQNFLATGGGAVYVYLYGEPPVLAAEAVTRSIERDRQVRTFRPVTLGR